MFIALITGSTVSVPKLNGYEIIRSSLPNRKKSVQRTRFHIVNDFSIYPPGEISLANLTKYTCASWWYPFLHFVVTFAQFSICHAYLCTKCPIKHFYIPALHLYITYDFVENYIFHIKTIKQKFKGDGFSVTYDYDTGKVYRIESRGWGWKDN